MAEGTYGAPMRSVAVVALKPLRSAKSRLRGIPAAYREHIAWCLAGDTIAALAAAVDQVVVVSNEPSLPARLRGLGSHIRVHPEGPSLGMNAALAAGARDASARDAGARDAGARDRGARDRGNGESALVIACVGDLPCLRPDTVRRLVHAAASHPRSFVPDSSGHGTTMLFARGVSLDPRFQGMSAAAHQGSGAVLLSEAEAGPLADARRDVDTLADLLESVRIGLGDRTAALFDPGTGRLGRSETITIVERSTDGTIAVTGVDGARHTLDPAKLPDLPPDMAPGQRIHAALVGDRVLSVWP